MLQTNSQTTETAIMPMLLAEIYTETMQGRHKMPMAALCKRLGLRMSTLQRHLTALAEHELVEVHCDESGRWTTKLTDSGIEIFTELAG